ncbi:MAG TPA: protoporphyrinogen oxidase [Segeticoccus sp.]|uniref:protoporphyrinogen oxidase n=1 Tax=Segeticoccus sp. TaxID=2706531 RepID=UPI002D7ED4F6|nr:protoporphyrinogen oxidase [Segeticoccus sp.]HET8601394.1 protoporphyrinogen oxidase [Segeticoccus sp.]
MSDLTSDPRRPRVVVLGGGISGLAAAWELVRSDPRPDVLVVEGRDRPGGKLRSAEVAGVRVDVGAESMLARRPEGVQLATEVGLAEELVHPEPVGAAIWSRGRLHPMPKGTLMGVPSDPTAAAGLLSPREVQRAQADTARPPLTGDVSVGDLVEEHLGAAVVDRLVEPLLGGVYAGHARALSVQASVPALWDAASRGESLTAAAARAAQRAEAARRETGNALPPVFAGLPGGLGRFAERLTEQLAARGVQFETDTLVRRLERTATGWRLVAGPVPTPRAIDADAIVLALPARPAGRLLDDVVPAAAARLDEIDYASMAIVTLALPRSAVGHLPALAESSGFLVPPVEGRVVKAATFSAAKWGWVAKAGAEQDVVLLRASIGRQGETADLHRGDPELIRAAVNDLGAVLGRPLPRPVDALVQRWGGALPQYAVGHLDRVAQIRAAVAPVPGLELAGAAYDGVGIPACIGTGRAAAQATLAALTRFRDRGAPGAQ